MPIRRLSRPNLSVAKGPHQLPKRGVEPLELREAPGALLLALPGLLPALGLAGHASSHTDFP